MTISEACKINLKECELYIEQQIKEGLEDGQTPYYIGKHLSGWLEKLFETKINPETLKSRAYRKQQKSGSNEPKDKPPKTQTKPDTKIQISEIAKEIKSGAVSDDHAKQIGDALADAITDGTCAKRVTIKRMTSLGV